MNGEVIGINTVIFSPSGGFIGIAFDVPATQAKPIVEQLRQHENVIRGWIGVQIQSVSSEIAESLGLPMAEGALVAELHPDGPAAKAGMAPGDVVASVDGRHVKDARGFARKIGDLAPGASVDLGMIRGGKTSSIKVTLGSVPASPAVAAAPEPPKPAEDQQTLGLSMAPAHDVAGAGDEGVIVTSVNPDGRAAAAGIEAGDIITEIGGSAIKTPADVGAAMQQAQAQPKRAVLMRLKSGGQTRFIAVPVG